MDILAGYYGSPDYLVFTQVILNLTHDPRTSEQALQTMNRINETAEPPLRRLQAQVLQGTGIRRPAMRSFLFHSLRGLALSQVMLGTIPSVDMQQAARQFPAQRKLLAEAIALLIEKESTSGHAMPGRRGADQAGLVGDDDELGAVAGVQFRHGALDVGAHGQRAEEEPFRDLAVSSAFGGQAITSRSRAVSSARRPAVAGAAALARQWRGSG